MIYIIIIVIVLFLFAMGIKNPAKQTEEEKQHEVDLMLYKEPLIEGETDQTRKGDDPPLMM